MFAASDHHRHHQQMLQYYAYPPHLGSPMLLPNNAAAMEKKWKPDVETAPSCPRCASPNTKFCYYNNYSLSQPRYFCKGCRRYWTKGGSLRNVPVGGGCRKNGRAKSSRRKSPFNNDRPKASCSSDHTDDAVSTPNGGSDIDLAVVFAKFLNESSSSQETDLSAAKTSNSSTPDNVVQNDDFNVHNVMGNGDLNILGEFPQVFGQLQEEEDRRVQDFLEDDMVNAHGLQALLGDEIVDHQVALWSDQAETETLPNFTWQRAMFQLQDFDSFPADDQLKASANLISDNWTSFDLPGFELYSRP